MLSARDYVEITALRRINKQHPDDLPVDIQTYDNLCKRLDNLIESLSKTHISGFEKEDLIGFMLMEVHRTLRQGKYDFERSPFAYYKVIFDNLLRNLNRNMNCCLKKEYFVVDSIEYVETYYQNDPNFNKFIEDSSVYY